MVSLENIYPWCADLLEGDQQGGRTRQQRRRVRGLSQKVSRNPIIEIQKLPHFILFVFRCITTLPELLGLGVSISLSL